MEFYVIINDEQQGPFTIDQLKTLNITPNTEVWAQGMDDWQLAGDVPALTTLLQQLDYNRHVTRAAATPPAPRPRPYVPQERTYEHPTTTKRHRGGCLLWTLLALAVLLVVMIITVPSREDHVNAIKDVTREWMSQTIDETGLSGSLLGKVAKWVGGTGANFLIDQMITCDNYIVCSVGRINYGTQSHRVSFGILGHVYTFDKDDINQAIKNAISPQEPAEPKQEARPVVTPPAPEVTPEPEEEPQVDEDLQEDKKPNPAQELIDSVTSRAKREAKRAAKEWVKKKIDEL